MKLMENNFDRVSPVPFLSSFAAGAVIWALSALGLPLEYIFANSTYINIIYGSVIGTAIMLTSCVLTCFPKANDLIVHKAYSVFRFFTDAAMAAAGFIAISGLYNEHYSSVMLLALGIATYTLAGNHLYHSIFNDHKGSRKLTKEIDETSGTRIGRGLVERDIERKVLATASIVISFLAAWLIATLYLAKP